MRLPLTCLLLLSCAHLSSEEPPISGSFFSLQEVQVNLKNPEFDDGVLSTQEGGVLTAYSENGLKRIRLQAQNITYMNKTVQGTKVMIVKAHGNLLVEYGGQFLIGDSLEYNFITHTGVLHGGRAGQGIWFVGGETVELKQDGSLYIDKGFLSTSEDQDNSWAIEASSVDVSQNALLSASDIKLKIFHIPCLWLPYFKTNLKTMSESPIQYKITFDKGLWPKATLRYRVFSWDKLNLFVRLDYRLKEGPGGAFESEYYSQDKRTTFITKSYGAYNKIVYDEHGLKRYRLQGLFAHESLDHKTHTHLTYDKFSDLKMISDFPSNDFEISTQERTRLLIHHQEENTLFALFAEPRLNTFESINQKLPLLKIGTRPRPLGSTGIFSENSWSGGYLNYVYANDLLNTYPTLKERHSGRVETKNRLYRPFQLGPCHFSPTVGIIGVLYSNTPQSTCIGQGVLTYGASYTSPFYKTTSSYRHTVEPYCTYTGISKPTALLPEHYTFNIEDGLYQINALKVGLKNSLSFLKSPLFSPDLSLDIYTYGFFFDNTFEKTFPKGYLTLSWNRPSYLLQTHFCRNFEEQVWDFTNLLGEFTLNEHCAFAAEFRHRSRFDWRKADHENFILDMARSIDSLLNSPLSDGRNTVLGRMQIRISPKWNCHLASHYGFGRHSEPSYRSISIDVQTLLTAKWQLKFSYIHTTNDDRFTMQMQLVK